MRRFWYWLTGWGKPPFMTPSELGKLGRILLYEQMTGQKLYTRDECHAILKREIDMVLRGK